MSAQPQSPPRVESLEVLKEPDRTEPKKSQALLAAVVTHRLSAAIVGVLLVVTGLAQGIGMNDAPQRIDDEGTYVAQAWAVLNLNSLTHYTYWYDHPPLGWLQLAGYAGLTGAFDRAPNAVAAGREFMLVVQLVSLVLLWLLARRIGLPRWGAALAAGLFSLSPLAIQFHRTVYLDNIATLWLLGAFVLALTPRRRLAAFAGAGLCFAIAVLTKETSLLMLPVLAWVLWRNSAGDTRRYALTVAASVFALAGVFYVLFALLKGEVLPGAERTSLLGGVLFQLADRASSGSIFTAGTLGNITLRQWLQLDVVLPVLSLPAVVIGLLLRRARPFAVAYLIMLAMMVRPGYLPVPFVIGMLPLAALLVAAAAVAGWERRGARYLALRAPGGRHVHLGVAVTAVIGIAAVVVATPRWYAQERGFVRAELDRPMSQATAWAAANLPREGRILTDDALWVDLVEEGFARENVVWFYKPDTDPAVPTGWRSYSWVISTDSMRTFPTSFATVRGALENSSLVAGFGSGDTRVEIRRVAPGGLPDEQQTQALQQSRSQAGQALAANPALRLPDAVGQALEAGRVDARLMTVLAAASARHTLRVEALPALDGDSENPLRGAQISEIDGRPVTSDSAAVVSRELAAQSDRYRPETIVRGTGADARLVLTFPVTNP